MRFDGTGANGVPMLDGCVAWLVARNRSLYDEGDHVILVGEVVDFGAPGGEPLIFHDGRYIASGNRRALAAGIADPLALKRANPRCECRGRKKRIGSLPDTTRHCAMHKRDVVNMVLLAALWGASFLFTRIAAPAFGAFALAEIRTAIAALMLLPLLAWRADFSELRARPLRFLMLGAVNTAFPFALFAYAALSITAGLASILNAAAPLFGALVAWIWLRERLTPLQLLGLAIGFAGVLWLSGAKAEFRPGGTGWAIVAGLVATISYGFSASVAKKYFGGVRPLSTAAGTQTAAALLLLPFAAYFWPSAAPTIGDWAAATALGVFCTGFAYLLYFRLISRIGPSKTITVTFLIPAFAMLWGALFLGEEVTTTMIAGCGVIIAGTALANGLLVLRR